MQRPTNLAWISTAILVGVLQGALATKASAQAPTPTRELDSPIRGDRYGERIAIPFPFNSSQASRTITPMVPDGKKLFLQSVSIFTLLTHGQSPYEAVVMIVPARGRNPLASLFVDMDFQAALGQQVDVSSRQRYHVGNRDINMVLNAGESISIRVSRNGVQGDPSVNASIVRLIGYFVDVDPQTPPSP